LWKKGDRKVLMVVKRLRQLRGATLSRVWVNAVEECYGLEPQSAPERNENNWAIPAGAYTLRLKELGTHQLDVDYSKRFGSAHKGMIEVVGVPQRTEILVQIGNSGLDTQGHLLVGLEYFEQPPRGAGIRDSFWLAKSMMAYCGLYEQLVKNIGKETIHIAFLDPEAGKGKG
jgi:hypothetical protein